MTLDQIAIKHGTDKSSKHHGYCEVYERYFEKLRNEQFVLIECGYGGYDYPERGGHGIRMWREYFPNATIIGTDLHLKLLIPADVQFYQGSQDDASFWNGVIDNHGRPEIFIDDASHINPLTIKTFEIMFPLLEDGGIYVIEDTHTSFFKEHGFLGGHHDGTIVNYFKRMLDKVMHNSGIHDPSIESIHFYDKLIFVFKK